MQHTEDARGPFEEEWARVARVLDRALRGRRLAREQREDIIQETGLRLFSRWDDVDPARPLEPLALTIAFNLLRDEARAAARREARPLPFAEISARSVEEEALARLELSHLAGALRGLTSLQREAVLAEIGDDLGVDRASAAMKMLRVRARRNLRNALGRASSLAPLAWRWLRDVGQSMGLALGRSTHLESAPAFSLPALGVAGASAVAVFTFGFATVPGGQSHAPQLGMTRPATRAAEPTGSAGRAERALVATFGHEAGAASARGTAWPSARRQRGSGEPATVNEPDGIEVPGAAPIPVPGVAPAGAPPETAVRKAPESAIRCAAAGGAGDCSGAVPTVPREVSHVVPR